MDKKITATVKIIDDKGYIKKGAIGVGFGAWSRAARIRNALKLSEMPISLPEEEWQALTAHRMEDITLER